MDLGIRQMDRGLSDDGNDLACRWTDVTSFRSRFENAIRLMEFTDC